MQKPHETLLAQYANSPTITALVEDINDWIDPAIDLDALYRNIWDIDTANDHGLDIWGRIVGIGRYLEVDDSPAYTGFVEAQTPATKLTGPQPFGSGGTLFNGAQISKTLRLSADAYRDVILWKAMANISDATIPGINRLLKFMFKGRGRAYAHDTGDMTMRYVFEFFLTPVEKAVLQQGKVVIKPAGVRVRIIEPVPTEFFGFAGTELQPFGSGILFRAPVEPAPTAFFGFAGTELQPFGSGVFFKN